MGLLDKKGIRKAFVAAAMFSAALGVLPPAMMTQAEASPALASMMASNAQRVRNAHAMQSEVLVNPSRQNIERLHNFGIIEASMLRHVEDTVREMKIPPGTEAYSITWAQRDQFMRTLRAKSDGYYSAPAIRLNAPR